MAFLLAGAACGGRPSQPLGARIGPAIAAALAAADDAREPWWCTGDEPSQPAETLTIGGRAWQLAGGTLKLEAGTLKLEAGTPKLEAGTPKLEAGTLKLEAGTLKLEAGTPKLEAGTPKLEAGTPKLGIAGGVTIGVIADAAGSGAATLAALGRLRGELDRVDVVISLGGMGATRGELEAVFTALADHAAWPLVTMPGDLEPVEAQAAAVAAARQRGVPVIDGRRLRRIELPAVTIALVPGAGTPGRLVAGADGCMYRAADVAAAFADLTPRTGLRILASAEPPRSGGRDEPTGELALVPRAGQQIDVALYGPTTAAASPARTGSRDGSAVPLTPGSCDATTRLPGPYRFPSAGVLAVRGDTWTWTPLDSVK